MEFGEYIRKIRKEKGISARELSRRTGISQAYLSQLETGKYKNPTKKVVIDLANGLNISRVEPLRKAGYLSEEDYQIINELKDFNEEMQEINKHNIRLLLLNDKNLHWDEKILTDKQRQDILNFIQNEIIGTEGGYYLFDFADKKKDGE